jgi:uncharacterized membrane protein (DUF2068 family)
MATPVRTAALPRLTPGLVGIVAFKYAKCAAFLLVGAAALRIARLPDHSEPLEIARALGVYEGRVTVRHLAALLAPFTPGEVEAIGLAAILIGLVFGAEGTCLAARIWWAPYLTIALTAAALPVETSEMATHPGRLRGYALFAANAAILVYLWGRRNDFRRTGPR